MKAVIIGACPVGSLGAFHAGLRGMSGFFVGLVLGKGDNDEVFKGILFKVVLPCRAPCVC